MSASESAASDAFDALYEDMIDVATWARENGHQIAYDWIMDRFAEWQNNERLLPSGAQRAARLTAGDGA
ncbi:MAG: hypothetical protein JWM40_2964 [Frankiales bacterium]|nr:hypothetical protein [Frankiales bacterium]